MDRWIVLGLLALSACHVTVRTEMTHASTISTIQHAEGAVARPPTLGLTAAGLLRFVEPLECPTEEVMQIVSGTEIETRPNLATFIVGVIATSIGGVLTVRGATGDGASDPLTYAGIAGLAVGVPLVIGPFVGTRTELVPGGEPASVRRPGPSESCGARAFPGRSATLTVRGIEVHGTIDHDGVFSISPYQLVDAYAPKEVSAWDVHADVEAAAGARTLSAVIEGGALASHARAFLDSAAFEAKIEPMRVVPGIVAGTLRASLTSTAEGPALRIVLPIKNDGPGDAWAVRGAIASPTRSVDGRIIYIGHLAKGAAISSELLIPLGVTAAETIRGSTLDLTVELRDAWGTAPATPVRFRGAVLGDAPR